MANKGYVLQSSDNDVANVSNILKETTGIDLKTIATHTIYSVPTGKKLILQDVIVLISADDTASVAATVRVGITAAFTEFVGNTTLTGLLSAGQYLSLAESAGTSTRKVMSNGDAVSLDITTGATATTLTATVYVIGYLV